MSDLWIIVPVLYANSTTVCHIVRAKALNGPVQMNTIKNGLSSQTFHVTKFPTIKRTLYIVNPEHEISLSRHCGPFGLFKYRGFL